MVFSAFSTMGVEGMIAVEGGLLKVMLLGGIKDLLNS